MEKTLSSMDLTLPLKGIPKADHWMRQAMVGDEIPGEVDGLLGWKDAKTMSRFLMVFACFHPSNH